MGIRHGNDAAWSVSFWIKCPSAIKPEGNLNNISHDTQSINDSVPLCYMAGKAPMHNAPALINQAAADFATGTSAMVLRTCEAIW